MSRGAMSASADVGRPVLFVTGHLSADRVGAFAALHEREGIELALFGGRIKHGPAGIGELAEGFEKRRPTRARAHARGHPDLKDGTPQSTDLKDRTRQSNGDMPPTRRVRELATGRLAASGRYRAVVVSTGGRVALGASWAGARRAGAPVFLWASLWAHPRSAVHALSYLALRRLYRSADGVVTYGPHVSAYVRERGAKNVHEACQSVDNEFWSARLAGETGAASAARAQEEPWPADARVRFLFAGRRAREKGIDTLLGAWRASGLGEAGDGAAAGDAEATEGDGEATEGGRGGACGLALVGVGADLAATRAASGVTFTEPVDRERMRELYARADVLVVPSIATRTFREPWGLVVNEAMNRGLAVICSDAVGAAAGGLVRDGRNGLVVRAGDEDGLAGGLRALAREEVLRKRLGAAGRRDVAAYSHEAWAEGFSRALATVGLSRGRW